MGLSGRDEELALNKLELAAVVIAARSLDPVQDALGVTAAVVPNSEADHTIDARRSIREVDVKPVIASETRMQLDSECTALAFCGYIEVDARSPQEAVLVENADLATVLFCEEDPFAPFDPDHVDWKVETSFVSADNGVMWKSRARDR